MLTLEAPVDKEFSRVEVLNYIKKCFMVEIKEKKNLKTIYFKDENGCFSVLINNLLYGSYTLLATVEDVSLDLQLSSDEFSYFWSKYKIFLV